jgi:hypothetical protein
MMPGAVRHAIVGTICKARPLSKLRDGPLVVEDSDEAVELRLLLQEVFVIAMSSPAFDTRPRCSPTMQITSY